MTSHFLCLLAQCRWCSNSRILDPWSKLPVGLVLCYHQDMTHLKGRQISHNKWESTCKWILSWEQNPLCWLVLRQYPRVKEDQLVTEDRILQKYLPLKDILWSGEKNLDEILLKEKEVVTEGIQVRAKLAKVKNKMVNLYIFYLIIIFELNFDF